MIEDNPENKLTENGVVRAEQGLFAPGTKPGPGRPKGTKNRFTQLREDYLEAFDHLGEPCRKVPGNEDLPPGAAYLVEFAKNNPKAYVAGLVKMLPAITKEELTIQPSMPTLEVGMTPEIALIIKEFEDTREANRKSREQALSGPEQGQKSCNKSCNKQAENTVKTG